MGEGAAETHCLTRLNVTGLRPSSSKGDRIPGTVDLELRERKGPGMQFWASKGKTEKSVNGAEGAAGTTWANGLHPYSLTLALIGANQSASHPINPSIDLSVCQSLHQSISQSVN